MKTLKKASLAGLALALLLAGCGQAQNQPDKSGESLQAVTKESSADTDRAQSDRLETDREEIRQETGGQETSPGISPEASPETSVDTVGETTGESAPEITQEMVNQAYGDAHKVESVGPNEAKVMAQNSAPAVVTVLAPVASGERVEQNGEAVIDYSHMEEGYVMVQYTASTDSRLKVQVKGPTTTYTYDLPRGAWTVFPLSDGNGDYQVVVYKNVTGTKYALVLSVSLSVALHDEFAPFLRPNQYVNFVEGSAVVTKGAELTAGLEDPLEKVEKVYDYVVGTLTYDKAKAASVTSGYLPVLDQVLQEKKGICFDYAALMTAMLRSQSVPCKLVVGYAGQTYHAWINVWTEKSGWVDGAIFFDGSVWKRMDPTFASSGSQSTEIMEYIGKDANYTVKYQY